MLDAQRQLAQAEQQRAQAQVQSALDLVALYKALGGEILTIGSDAHCTADIGRDIYAGVEMAQAAGFKYLTYFKKHEPKFIKIEI